MPEIIVKLGDRIIHRYFFDKEMVSVGRARDNDIVIENLSVSRNHARFKKQDGKFILTDMNSANGTLVNGVRVSKTEVAHNDEITVGKHTLIFVVDSAAASSGGRDEPSDLQVDGVADAPPASSPAVSLPVNGAVGILSVQKGKQVGSDFRVTKSESFVGRAGENDIRIHDWFVSKKHAVITVFNGAYVLRDLDSWRGTTVNGNSIREIELKDGDEIVLGTTTLSFHLVDPASVPEVPAPVSASDDQWNVDQSEWESQRAELDDLSEVGAVTDSGKTSDQVPKQPVSVRGIPPAKGPAHGQELLHASAEDLDQLEAEFDHHVGTDAEEEENRRAAWEMTEMERSFETGNNSETIVLGESDEELLVEEENFRGVALPIAGYLTLPDDYDSEEEEALYGAAMTDEEPYGQPVLAVAPPSAVIARPVPAVSAPAPAAQTSTSSAAVPLPAAGAAFEKEIAMWEKALNNKSSLIRKNAAKELKKLTGKDYDWTIDPSGN